MQMFIKPDPHNLDFVMYINPQKQSNCVLFLLSPAVEVTHF